MGRPFYSDERVEAGRRQLADAALKLYRQQGYEAVTLRSLGAAVGISSATPYRFFESKDALFDYVRTMVYTTFGEHLQAADPGSGDPMVRLRRVSEAMVDFGLKYPEDYRLIFSMRQGPIPPDSPLYIARRRTLEHVISLCQAIIDSGRMTGDARVQVHVAWAAIHGLVSFHVSNQLTHGVGIEDIVGPMLDRLYAPGPGAAPKAAKKTAGRSMTAKKRRARSVA